MNVSFLTEGGSHIGLGHITRCTALSQAFNQADCKTAVYINGDASLGQLFNAHTFIKINWLDNEAWRTVAEQADVVIVDSYQAPLETYIALSKSVKVPVFIDDTVRLPYPPGVVLNGSIGAENLPYNFNLDIKYLLGIQFQPMRMEFWPLSRKKINPDVSKILITMGGEDVRGITPAIMQTVLKHFPHIQQIVLMTDSFGYHPDTMKLANAHAQLVINPTAAQLRHIMESVDVAVSGGGQTLYELAHLGVPTISVRLAENQAQNIDAWGQQGFVRPIGSWNDPQFESSLIIGIKETQSPEVRQLMSNAGQTMCDGAGARRVVEEILKMVAR